MNNKTLDLTRASLIAALYVVLTIIANLAGMASGAIQLRLSEMLTILPVFTWAAVPGLTMGCVIANLVTGCALWDIVFGSLATFLGAIGTYYIGKKKPRIKKTRDFWSGRRESNPRIQLGKLMFYH